MNVPPHDMYNWMFSSTINNNNAPFTNSAQMANPDPSVGTFSVCVWTSEQHVMASKHCVPICLFFCFFATCHKDVTYPSYRHDACMTNVLQCKTVWVCQSWCWRSCWENASHKHLCDNSLIVSQQCKPAWACQSWTNAKPIRHYDPCSTCRNQSSL